MPKQEKSSRPSVGERSEPGETAPQPDAVAAPAAKPVDPVFCTLMAWLVPGYGYWLLGRRALALQIGGLIAVTFLIGLVLSDFQAVSRALNPFSYFAQLGVGSGTLIVSMIDPAQKVILHSPAELARPVPVSKFWDAGLLFCNVAGLLNYLAVLDVIDRLVKARSTEAES